ncbi:MAG: hypothetical protein HEP80_14360 [Dolichospermum sp. UKL201]|jgi:hypothetical protein|nr:MAG: hypothetical protein HEP80_14360 [Dolichospermum sp. UKL201]
MIIPVKRKYCDSEADLRYRCLGMCGSEIACLEMLGMWDAIAKRDLGIAFGNVGVR